jgi:hypothetical protein
MRLLALYIPRCYVNGQSAKQTVKKYVNSGKLICHGQLIQISTCLLHKQLYDHTFRAGQDHGAGFVRQQIKGG